MRILAWDPGAKGAFVYHDGTNFFIKKTPEDEARLGRMLFKVLANTDLFIYESQTGFAGTRNSGPAMFKFGNGYGFVRTYATCLNDLSNMPFKTRSIRPQDWQSPLGLVKPVKIKKPRRDKKLTGEKKKEYDALCYQIDAQNAPAKYAWKKALCEEAQRWKPQLNVTRDNCDALLIMRYALEFLSHE